MPSSLHLKSSDLKKSVPVLLGMVISAFIYFIGIPSMAEMARDSVTVTEMATGENGIPTDQTIIDAGQNLFKNNCAVCHALREVVIGPALANVYERRDIEWIKAFVRNSQQVIQSGDEYAVNLYNQYNKVEMTAFDFSDEEILSIIGYIKYETENPPPPIAAVTPAGEDTTVSTSPGIISQKYLIAILIGLTIIMILILVVLVLLVTTITRYLRQKESLTEVERKVLEQKINIWDMVRSPAFVGVVTFLFIAIFAKAVIDSLYLVGVQQNYSPTQPIAYSHKLHAGDYAIECEYCHTGGDKSKNANIPSANICMNCHSGILKVTGSDEVSEEIMKIYEAVETGTPIEWVRVNNLPDLAYFNHAQHFNVGGIECQTCHGPIEEMEVVRQFEDLTMGWCIDCHRTTEIKSDNPYYDELVALHEETSISPMTVEDIGGLECSKCHY